MLYVVVSLVTAAAVIAAVLLWRRFVLPIRQPPSEQALTLLQQQVNASIQQTTQQAEMLRRTLQESVQMLAGQISRSLADTHKTVGDRLDATSSVVADVRQKLGQLEASSQRIIEIGQDISKLEDLLQPPKLRGALGELFLADLLAQILPAHHYRLQYPFKGGEIVDAVIMLQAGMVPVDAKFPLENFRRIFSAQNDDDRKAARRSFIKDVKGHIDAIAGKYVRMDEGTFDFALMYVPAENVYYETIIKDDEFGGEMLLFTYALKKRVIPVSPNTFYAYLQTILLGLKGMRVEEHSREILENLSRLHKEFDAFVETFRLVGQHLDNSSKKFSEAQKRLDRVEAKVELLDGLARGLEPADATPVEGRADLTRADAVGEGFPRFPAS